MHTKPFQSLTSLALLAALLPLGAIAQTTTTTKKTTTAKTTTTTRKPGVRKPATAAADEIKLPASIPAAPGKLQTLYALRYIEIKVGTGAPALPGEIYKVHYTGWLHDGTKFDSSVDRGQPFEFPQGRHRVITGWDEGFDGMKVGGKRRMFIPYQLAYGAQANGPIPAKSDLIFDIELLDARDPNAPATPTAPPAKQ
jgi:peptidylprolyl isomerase